MKQKECWIEIKKTEWGMIGVTFLGCLMITALCYAFATVEPIRFGQIIPRFVMGFTAGGGVVAIIAIVLSFGITTTKRIKVKCR